MTGRIAEEDHCELYNQDRSRLTEVIEAMPPAESFEIAVRLLKGVAEPVRARILYAISEKELCVCELAYLLDMSLPAVSHHLRILRDTDLIRSRKAGKLVFHYPANREIISILRSLIDRRDAEEAMIE